MRNETVYNKKLLTKVLVEKIESERNPKEIKTQHIKKYRATDKIAPKGKKEEGFFPDIVVSYDEESHIYAIELDEKPKFEKWKLLSHHAKNNNGNFYLVVPDWLKDNLKEKLKEQNINAGLLYFYT